MTNSLSGKITESVGSLYNAIKQYFTGIKPESNDRRVTSRILENSVLEQKLKEYRSNSIDQDVQGIFRNQEVSNPILQEEMAARIRYELLSNHYFIPEKLYQTIQKQAPKKAVDWQYNLAILKVGNELEKDCEKRVIDYGQKKIFVYFPKRSLFIEDNLPQYLKDIIKNEKSNTYIFLKGR